MTTETTTTIDRSTFRQELIAMAYDSIEDDLMSRYEVQVTFGRDTEEIAVSHELGWQQEIFLGRDPEDPNKFEVGTRSFKHSKITSNMTLEGAVTKFKKLLNERTA